MMTWLTDTNLHHRANDKQNVHVLDEWKNNRSYSFIRLPFKRRLAYKPQNTVLTYWVRDKMAAISTRQFQMDFANENARLVPINNIPP